MPASLTANQIFLSTVSDDFENAEGLFPGLRSRLRFYISRAQGQKAVVQEEFPQVKAATIQKLDDILCPCSTVIHLVGGKPGALPSPEEVTSYLADHPDFLHNQPNLRATLGDFSGISYTQWEAFMALHHEKALFVYASPDAPAQQTHLDRLKLAAPKRYASSFKDEAELLGQLIGDLRPIVPHLEREVPLTGALSPLRHWELLLQTTAVPGRPELPAKLLTVERDVAVKALEDLSARTGAILTLVAESHGDVDDFVAGWLQTLDTEARDKFSGRFFLIRDKEAAMSFVSREGPLVLIAHPSLELERPENRRIMDEGKANGHCWILPAFHEPGETNSHVAVIRSPKSWAIQEALRAAGFQETEARRLGDLGHRRLAGLFRELRGVPVDPEYASWPEARPMAQACLLGKWNANRQGDREMVAALVGEPYEDWIARLRPVLLRSDTPIIQNDQHWRVLVRSEAWNCLGRQLHDSDLDAFREAAVMALGELNPELQQPAKERGLTPENRTYSGELREGLADTLAILGTHPQPLTQCSHGKGEVTALLAVRTLLEEAPASRWASLNHHLPLLAEAAPCEFIEAVSSSLKVRCLAVRAALRGRAFTLPICWRYWISRAGLWWRRLLISRAQSRRLAAVLR